MCRFGQKKKSAHDILKKYGKNYNQPLLTANNIGYDDHPSANDDDNHRILMTNTRDSHTDYSSTFRRNLDDLNMFTCLICNKMVRNRWHHFKMHCPQNIKCNICNQVFRRKDNYKLHVKMKHPHLFSISSSRIYRKRYPDFTGT